MLAAMSTTMMIAIAMIAVMVMMVMIATVAAIAMVRITFAIFVVFAVISMTNIPLIPFAPMQIVGFFHIVRRKRNPISVGDDETVDDQNSNQCENGLHF